MFKEDYIRSEKTDIRKTWVENWPKSSQDAVYKRIKAHVEAGENIPETMKIVNLKGVKK